MSCEFLDERSLQAVLEDPASVVTLGIGGLVYALADRELGLVADPGEIFARFVADGSPNIVIQVIYGVLPSPPFGSSVFDSQGPWSLYESHDMSVFTFHRRDADESRRVYSVLQITQDLGRGCLYVSRDAERSVLEQIFGYPISEVLSTSLLAQGRGIEMHAAGLVHGNQGELFCGASGAGKSTSARLWCNEPAVEILSDDRIIVRRQEGQFRIYGTPWHGEAAFASPASAPLQRVFLLRQGTENRVRKLSTLEAVRRLTLCTFLPYWNREGVAFSLSFLEELASTLPCYELTFVNDHSVVDFVRRL